MPGSWVVTSGATLRTSLSVFASEAFSKKAISMGRFVESSVVSETKYLLVPEKARFEDGHDP